MMKVSNLPFSTSWFFGGFDLGDWIIVPQKSGGIGSSNGFHIKWIIGTQENWKNKNPGGPFGATS